MSTLETRASEGGVVVAESAAVGTGATGGVAGVGRNATILAGATLFTKLGSLAVVPFILRYFSQADYGTYSVAFAYAGILGMVTQFGMGPIIIRDIARGDEPRGRAIFHCAAIRLALAVVAAGALLALGLVQGFSPQMWVLSWVAFACIAFDAVTGTVRSSMQATGRFGSMAGVDVVRKSIQWLFAIGAIVAGMGIVALAAGAAAASAAALATAIALGVRRADFSEMKFAPGYAAKMLRLSAPMGISAILLMAFEKVDIWMLDALKSREAVSVYAAGVAFKPAFISQCVVWAILPLAFRLAKEDRPALAGAVRVTGRYLLIAAGAIAFVCLSGGEVLLPLLAGAKYAASVSVFKVVAVSLPFSFVSFLYLHALTAIDRQGIAAWIFGIGLAINVLLGLVLVPSMGPVGAITATLAAEVFMAAAAFGFVWRLVGRPVAARDAGIGVAAAGAAAVAVAVEYLGMRDFGLTSGAAFVVLTGALGGFTRDDLAMIRRSFANR